MGTLKTAKKLEDKISERITSSDDEVFMRKDFSNMGDYNSVGRSLSLLVRKGKIVKIGHGLYAKAAVSPLTQRIIPRKGLRDLAVEVLKKIGVEIVASSYDQAYNEGRSTQVPTGRVIGVKKRIDRKIGYGGKYVTFERVD